ncbi:MAG: hypothetical protein IT290_03645, partial [Deltaproteobacteria bacterium]|nr:hypothetical protein [Deltaproteobacteria bacterium]
MTERSTASRRTLLFYRTFVVFSLAAFVIGVVLRYQFICVDNRPSNPDNILGDAAWYVHHAVNTFEPGYQPTMYDTLFPPGAAMFYYVLRTLDGSFRLVDYVMWVLASLVPVILSATAWRLYGARVAWFVLAFASLYFPLWEYFGYLISEGPFIFTLVLTFSLLVLSLEAETLRRSVAWAFFAGIVLGACTVTKSCALVTAAFIALALLWGQRKRKFRVWPTFLAAAVGVVLVIAPVSIRATRLNEGRFLLIANDSPRTFLLGHQGRVGLTWWYDAKRDFRMNFVNPSTLQHGYHEERSYPFGVYETGPNYAAGLTWVKENPLEALLLSIEHVFDMFATALPWPGYFRTYVG